MRKKIFGFFHQFFLDCVRWDRKLDCVNKKTFSAKSVFQNTKAWQRGILCYGSGVITNSHKKTNITINIFHYILPRDHQSK